MSATVTKGRRAAKRRKAGTKPRTHEATLRDLPDAGEVEALAGEMGEWRDNMGGAGTGLGIFRPGGASSVWKP